MRQTITRSFSQDSTADQLRFAELGSSFAFCSAIITLAVKSLIFHHYRDNFDHDRFGIERRPSATRQIKRAAQTIFWLLRSRPELYETYILFSDPRSKILYVFLLAYRIAWYSHVKIPASFSNEHLDDFREIQKYTESKYPLGGMFGGLRRYDFEFEGQRYVSDGLGFECILFRRQYFYSTRDLTVAPEAGDFVIDGGAFTGDSALVFSNAVGEDGLIYSFDPVAEHIELIESNIRLFPFKNVKVMPFGLYDKEVFCEPVKMQSYSPDFETTSTDVPLRSLDLLVENNIISRIDFIKLDIEGAEISALKGAINSIKAFKPKLAISLYHNQDDIFRIPLFIKQNFPFYRFVLGHYTIHTEETILYATPVERAREGVSKEGAFWSDRREPLRTSN